ncbi:hypothetical protein C8Q74DRAFT_327294 [Fomes fomentarius]|nr:hypothetical protein C8Q74DRAFT_327294 [Fomes fomentarius]
MAAIHRAYTLGSSRIDWTGGLTSARDGTRTSSGKRKRTVARRSIHRLRLVRLRGSQCSCYQPNNRITVLTKIRGFRLVKIHWK